MKKKKRIQQPETFWNLNNGSRVRSKNPRPQKIVFVQPISNKELKNGNKLFDFRMNKPISFGPNVKKQRWGISNIFNLNQRVTKIRMPKIPKTPKVPKINGMFGIGMSGKHGMHTLSNKNSNGFKNLNFMNGNKNGSKKMKDSAFMPKGLATPLVPQNSLMPNNLHSAKSKNLGFLNGAFSNRVGERMRLFEPVKMTPSPLFRKQTIYDKHLNPWGDVDMDGSINYFDCDPRDVAQDGILSSIKGAISSVFGRNKDVSREEVQEVIEEGEEPEIGEAQQLIETIEKEEKFPDDEKFEKKLEDLEPQELEPKGETQEILDTADKDIIKERKHKEERRESIKELSTTDVGEEFDDRPKGFKAKLKAGIHSVTGTLIGKEKPVIDERMFSSSKAKRKELGEERFDLEQDYQESLSAAKGQRDDKIQSIEKELEGATGDKKTLLESRLRTIRKEGKEWEEARERSFEKKDRTLKKKVKEFAESEATTRRRLTLESQRDPGRKDYKLKAKILESNIQEKLRKGQQPSAKEIAALDQAKRDVRDLTSVRGILTKHVSDFTGVPYDIKERRWDTIDPKTGRVSKGVKRVEAGIQRKVKGILAAALPAGAVSVAAVSRGRSEGKQGRGRPSGPSGKYMVDGIPVSESKYQQVRSAENKKRKMMGMAKVPTGSFQLNTVKQAVPRQETRQVMPQQQDDFSVRNELVIEQPQQSQRQQFRTPQTIEEQQWQEQQQDNILHAPNFQAGELQETAGVFKEDPRYNILNAPNFQQGALRNVGATEETPAVVVGDRPNPNPYGEEYTDIDPGSGRTIVQRRPNEKWVTGEAL